MNSNAPGPVVTRPRPLHGRQSEIMNSNAPGPVVTRPRAQQSTILLDLTAYIGCNDLSV